MGIKQQGLEAIRKFRAQVVRELRKAGQAFQTHMVTQRLSGPTGPNSLSVRTGQLRRSVAYRVFERGSNVNLLGVIGPGVPYARAHEFGATIRPVRAKALAIPVGPAKTRAGVSRGGPRSYQDLFFIRKRRGNLVGLLAKKVGRRGTKLKVYFLLVKQVRIPARLGFRKTFKQFAQFAIARIQNLAKSKGFTENAGARGRHNRVRREKRGGR